MFSNMDGAAARSFKEKRDRSPKLLGFAPGSENQGHPRLELRHPRRDACLVSAPSIPVLPFREFGIEPRTHGKRSIERLQKARLPRILFAVTSVAQIGRSAYLGGEFVKDACRSRPPNARIGSDLSKIHIVVSQSVDDTRRQR
jgi:hypothetical protein